MKTKLINIIKRFKAQKITLISAIWILSVSVLFLFALCIILTIITNRNYNKYVQEKNTKEKALEETDFWHDKYYECMYKRAIVNKGIKRLETINDNLASGKNFKVKDTCYVVGP